MEPVAYRSTTTDDEVYKAERMAEAFLKYEEDTKNVMDTGIKFNTTIHEIKFTGKINRLEQNPDGVFEVRLQDELVVKAAREPYPTRS